MVTLFIILIAIAAVLMVLVILSQSTKTGAGSTFGGSSSQQIGNVKKTTDVLERMTWIFIVVVVGLCIMVNFMYKPATKKKKKKTTYNVEQNIKSLS